MIENDSRPGEVNSHPYDLADLLQDCTAPYRVESIVDEDGNLAYAIQ